MTHEAFQCGYWKEALFLALPEQGHCYLSSFGVVLSLTSDNSSHACASEYSTEYSSRSAEFSLYATLSPLWYSSKSRLWSSQTLFLSLHLRKSAGLYLGSPSLHHSLKTLMTVILGNHRSHLICFQSLRDYYPSLPDVHVLKTVVSFRV